MYAYRCPGKSRSLPTIPTYVHCLRDCSLEYADIRNVNLDQYPPKPCLNRLLQIFLRKSQSLLSILLINKYNFLLAAPPKLLRNWG